MRHILRFSTNLFSQCVIYCDKRRSNIVHEASFRATHMPFVATARIENYLRAPPRKANPKCKRRNRQPVANNRDSAEAGASVEYGNIRGEF